MDKTLREALDKVSAGLRELAVVIDSALAAPDPDRKLADAVDSLETVVGDLLLRMDAQGKELAVLTGRVNFMSADYKQLREDHDELSSKVTDLDESFNDRCDERIDEKVQEIDLSDRITDAVDDHDFSDEIEQAIESALSGRKVEATITF